MIRSTRAIAIVAFSALAFVACGGDTKPAEAPATPSAEPPPAPETDAGTSVTPPAADAATAKADAVPAPNMAPLTDEQIAAITDAANTSEIDEAKLAERKSKDPAVKKFAAMMITQHGVAKMKQAKLKLKPAESATSTAMTADAASTMDALKSEKGKDFDKAYIAAQVDGHQKALDTINDKLLPNVKSAELKAYIDGLKLTVEAHLKAAEQLQENFDGKTLRR